MSLYYLTNDLMFASRVNGIAQQFGLSLRMLGTIDDLLLEAKSSPCRLVLLDLTLPNIHPSEVVTRVKAEHPTACIIAYGPHVQEALLNAAINAGCDEVLTRGQFNQDIQRILRTGMA